ncbi:sulfotransferase [Kordiimonas sp. SCSIO 12610]|uniref:sulfotransferase n=1 Tax=Kordiimonas sp. SCSIO 12610 TaxID=2829597 RepID=UPI00210B2A8E|nr:sulfotransferase [Kordiimonas sp. SCSIO 12610]UTW56266.1 sulfotransferase [Kordiimonas sp. SCSIO 12610]
MEPDTDLRSDYPSEGFVFIVTYGRSGSTVMQSVLQAMDGYFIRGENNNALAAIFDFYEALNAAQTKNTKPNPPPHGPWYGIDEVDVDAVTRKAVDLFVSDVLKVPVGTRKAGFKEIRFHDVGVERFSHFLDFIVKFFPNTKFVFNKRDADGVSKSGWWRDVDYYDVLDMVETCDQLFDDYTRANPDICFTTKYEDFKGNPDAFRGLCAFMGEPFDEVKIKAIVDHKLKH